MSTISDTSGYYSRQEIWLTDRGKKLEGKKFFSLRMEEFRILVEKTGLRIVVGDRLTYYLSPEDAVKLVSRRKKVRSRFLIEIAQTIIRKKQKLSKDFVPFVSLKQYQMILMILKEKEEQNANKDG